MLSEISMFVAAAIAAVSAVAVAAPRASVPNEGSAIVSVNEACERPNVVADTDASNQNAEPQARSGQPPPPGTNPCRVAMRRSCAGVCAPSLCRISDW